MPTPSNIVITSGEQTLTFKPKASAPGSASFEERSAGVAVGYNQFTVSTEDLPQVRRVKLHVRMNHIAAASGADASGYTPGPKLDRFDEVDIVFKSNRRSNVADRTTLINLAKGLLTNADILAVVQDEEEIL